MTKQADLEEEADVQAQQNQRNGDQHRDDGQGQPVERDHEGDGQGGSPGEMGRVAHWAISLI